MGGGVGVNLGNAQGLGSTARSCHGEVSPEGVGDRNVKAIRVVLPGEFPRCTHGCRINLLRISDSLVSSTFSQGLGGSGRARPSETVARSRRDFGVQGGGAG